MVWESFTAQGTISLNQLKCLKARPNQIFFKPLLVIDFTKGLSLTASIFEIEQSSPQVADYDPSTLDVVDSEITGFDLQLQEQVIETWVNSAG